MAHIAKNIDLRSIALFSDLPEKVLEKLLKHMTIHTYPRATIIFREGDHAGGLYFIHSGKVRIFVGNEEGRELVLRTQGQGEYFGEMSLFSEVPRSASVKTVEETKLSLISRPDFKVCLTESPEISYHLISMLSHRIRLLTDEMKNLSFLDVSGRLARLLIDQSTNQDGRWIVKGLTQQEIADMIGASREMVSRSMRDLIKSDHILVDGNTIIIKMKLPV
ncbi:MAG TPA: cyclic nucleotide-binding domain-containing protein [Acidiferrobacteraceae bacterium]|nr:cyclic nucleotide-binding domain-containing protein [Acidiferrobacteraceae bacterium]